MRVPAGYAVARLSITVAALSTFTTAVAVSGHAASWLSAATNAIVPERIGALPHAAPWLPAATNAAVSKRIRALSHAVARLSNAAGPVSNTYGSTALRNAVNLPVGAHSVSNTHGSAALRDTSVSVSAHTLPVNSCLPERHRMSFRTGVRRHSWRPWW
jgi:hypothetical protein